MGDLERRLSEGGLSCWHGPFATEAEELLARVLDNEYVHQELKIQNDALVEFLASELISVVGVALGRGGAPAGRRLAAVEILCSGLDVLTDAMTDGRVLSEIFRLDAADAAGERAEWQRIVVLLLDRRRAAVVAFCNFRGPAFFEDLASQARSSRAARDVLSMLLADAHTPLRFANACKLDWADEAYSPMLYTLLPVAHDDWQGQNVVLMALRSMSDSNNTLAVRLAHDAFALEQLRFAAFAPVGCEDETDGPSATAAVHILALVALRFCPSATGALLVALLLPTTLAAALVDCIFDGAPRLALLQRDGLGAHRLALAKLVAAAAGLRDAPDVDAALQTSGALATLIDLFFHFEHAALLHAAVADAVIGILETALPKRAGLRAYVVDDCALLSRAEASYADDTARRRHPPSRQAHLGRICDAVNVALRPALPGFEAPAGDASPRSLAAQPLALDPPALAAWLDFTVKCVAPRLFDEFPASLYCDAPEL
ncbi:hypothetical protein M885DRAFT_509805 [Pelagophyceae sp. CCMP2097]|nr:hypothetical protein M885DRAFT_509805 [Pelagophyceae sp. CCMP2097]